MLSQVVELIENKNRFAITSHIRPDGDSLGSSLGLFWLLRALDKDVEVIMRDSAPPAYQKLPGAGRVFRSPYSQKQGTFHPDGLVFRHCCRYRIQILSGHRVDRG